MKVTWKGEEGGPDEVTVPVADENGALRQVKFKAGKAVDLPESSVLGNFVGNPMFTIDQGKPADQKPVDLPKDAPKDPPPPPKEPAK